MICEMWVRAVELEPSALGNREDLRFCQGELGRLFQQAGARRVVADKDHLDGRGENEEMGTSRTVRADQR